MSDELTATLQLLLTWVAPPLAAALVAFVVHRAGELWLEFKLNQPDVAGAIEQAADMAVKAAEQTGLNKKILADGAAKKNYAIQVAQAWLASKGVKFDLFLLDAAIEAAVNENFSKA